MSDIFYQKVAECSSEGELKIKDDEAFAEYLNDLFDKPRNEGRLEELLKLGQLCLDEQNESIALEIYQRAYYSLNVLECSKERKIEYAQRVLRGLCYLSDSNCEYIWEGTGEFIHACRDYINNLSPGTIK